MQRRLTLALALTALVSILLVGLGILAIGQLGAQSRAEDDVVSGLNVVDRLTNRELALPQLQEQLVASRRDLDLFALQPVLVGPDGSVEALVFGRGGGRARFATVAELPDLTLSDDELAELDEDGTVLVSAADAVVGVRTLPDVGFPGSDDQRVAFLAAQRVVAIPGQTVAWFVASSAVVLVGALIGGGFLARRLIRPIGQIEAATAAISAGQLDARVEVDGNDELAQLGRSVNRMAADLERSRALDQQFLMSVSHDLRTPLTAISGYAEALRDGAVGDSSGAGEVIGNHAARLERLVGDLLDLAKLDANRFRLELRTVDLEVVVGRTVAGLAPEALQRGVVLERHTSPATSPAGGPTGGPTTTVLADADRLAQAIGNVVTNAISFARQVVTIDVTVTGPGPDGPGAEAVVTVDDDGPGFAAEDLPYVFDRLYTGAARPRRAESSSGLGLAIVRELMAAMGGRVEAENNAAGGARIRLLFPLGAEVDR